MSPDFSFKVWQERCRVHTFGMPKSSGVSCLRTGGRSGGVAEVTANPSSLVGWTSNIYRAALLASIFFASFENNTEEGGGGEMKMRINLKEKTGWSYECQRAKVTMCENTLHGNEKGWVVGLYDLWLVAEPNQDRNERARSRISR